MISSCEVCVESKPRIDEAKWRTNLERPTPRDASGTLSVAGRVPVAFVEVAVPDLNELLALLKSVEPDERSRAVERAAVAIERLTHGVVASLENAGDHQRYVADHVQRFGTLMVEPLTALLARAEDPDTRVLCSLLLLRLHSNAGIDQLQRAVTEGSQWSVRAARVLAEAEVHEAAPTIVHRLRTVDLALGEEIEGLLEALETLEHAIPADLAARFSGSDAPVGARKRVEAAQDATMAASR